jgi:hypothetical protein
VTAGRQLQCRGAGGPTHRRVVTGSPSRDPCPRSSRKPVAVLAAGRCSRGR